MARLHCFNPRPRAGGDLNIKDILAPSGEFQSTPPRGGRRDAGVRPCDGRDQFQSTPPRGGRRTAPPPVLTVGEVSIHAPARGATLGACPRCIAKQRFQSTPPRGGRPRMILAIAPDRAFQSTPPRGGRRVLQSGMFEARPSFNPRPRAGGDAQPIHHRAGPGFVSIHAPARGATRVCPSDPTGRAGFQSTPPRGGRPFVHLRKC